MEQVIRVYGKFLLDAFLLGALIGLLLVNVQDAEGNRGIFTIIGAHIETGTHSNSEFLDYKVYESQSERSAPVIAYVREGLLYTGKYTAAEIVKASDNTGRELPVLLLSLCSPYGVELLEKDKSGITEIEFSCPGIYVLKAAAVDEWNRKSVCTIRLPVNRQEENN